MKTISNICANGKVGFGMESGKSYAVKDPCKNQALQGHVFCERCRVAAGGRRKRRVSLPAQNDR